MALQVETFLSRIARWDGSLWQPIGTGTGGSVVLDMTTHQGDLIAVGQFFGENVKRWNGTQWLPLDQLVSSAYTVNVFQGELLVGGVFPMGISRWFESEVTAPLWIPLGQGLQQWSAVNTLIEYEGHLFAGGDIIAAEGLPVRNLARWTGTNWNSLGPGSNGAIRSLVHHNATLCIAGDLGNSGYVAQWQDEQWTNLGSAFNAGVTALHAYDGFLIAGGKFTSSLEGNPLGRIAKWDGQQWSSMGEFDGEILNFATVDGELIAMGDFNTASGSPASRVARWTGETWQAMFPGLEFDYGVRDIIQFAGDIYVAGDFTTINGELLAHIARWDGSKFHTLAGFMNGPVHVLSEFQGDLVVGGNFTLPSKSIARWNGIAWNTLGGGALPCEESTCQAIVRSFAIAGDLLYVAGVFKYVSSSTGQTSQSPNIAIWNGNAWTAFPLGVGDYKHPLKGVHAMSQHNSAIVVAGDFVEAGGQPAKNIVAFTPGPIQTWFTVGDGFDSSIYDIAEFEDDLIIAGNFENSPGGFHNGITRWDGSAWHDLDGGMDGSVRALETYDGSLIAGGLFMHAGNASAKSLAKWNGDAWSELAPVTGSLGEVRALAVCGPDLYIAGQFESVGGVTALNIAKWDGNTAHPLGTELTGSVSALAFYEGDLIVGGALLVGGNVPVYGVARWDGAAWHPLDTGVSNCPTNACVGNVYALAVHNGDLIVGGSFVYAGGEPASNIARWDGNAWHAMGAGFNGTVRALCSFGGNLYAAGSFTLAEGILVHRIAVWDGTQWKALPDGGVDSSCFGSSCNAVASMLAPYKGDLYVGGWFAQVGSAASPYLAKLVSTCNIGDVNSDGEVNFVDLLQVVQHWGPCGSALLCEDSPCGADLNFSGAVDVQDLLTVISNWTG